MTTYYLNGIEIPEGSDINLGGFTYPYSWLEGTTQAVRASFGIEKQSDNSFETKYYWAAGVEKHLEDREEVDQDGNPLFNKVFDPETGNMVDTNVRSVSFGLKTTCLDEIRSTTNQLLQPTDFYIVRNHVESTEIPAEVATYREAVVNESTRLQEAIPAVTTVEELIGVMTSINWPKAQ